MVGCGFPSRWVAPEQEVEAVVRQAGEPEVFLARAGGAREK